MAGWVFGEITIDRVLEHERTVFALETLYPTARAAALEPHREWLVPRVIDPATGLLVLAFHTFVVRTPRRTILVDTCTGNDKPRPQKPRYHLNRWPYLERLAALGVAPERVDLVVSTHLHVDHVGWNTRLVDGRWTPTFPRARYLLVRPEWEYWREEYKRPAFRDDPYYEDSLLPVLEAGAVDLVEAGHALDDGVWLEPSHGHTPGHVCVRVRGGGREAVMSGDLMHTAVQCARPDWSSCFCVDAEASRRTRRAFLESCADTDTLVLPAHFPSPGGGRVVRSGDAYRFVFEGPTADRRV
jgi:glyoxylase-like metal-dependent hydrolase (beta-lactamase superfamily II)